MALRLADLDEELTFDSIRAGRAWTGVDGLSPTLPESTCDFLVWGHTESLLCDRGEPTRSTHKCKNTTDPDKSDIDKTREPSKRRLRLHPTRRAEFGRTKCFAGRKFQLGMLLGRFRRVTPHSKRWYGGRSHECFEGMMNVNFKLAVSALAQPRNNGALLGFHRCHVVCTCCA